MNSARMLGFGVWRSLVARLVRDEKVEGSNPFTPTNTTNQQYCWFFYLLLDFKTFSTFSIEKPLVLSKIK